MVNLVINFLPTEWFFTISILQNKKLEACCTNVTQKSWPDCSSRNMLNHLNTFLRHDKHSFLQLGKFKSIVKQKKEGFDMYKSILFQWLFDDLILTSLVPIILIFYYSSNIIFTFYIVSRLSAHWIKLSVQFWSSQHNHLFEIQYFALLQTMNERFWVSWHKTFRNVWNLLLI